HRRPVTHPGGRRGEPNPVAAPGCRLHVVSLSRVVGPRGPVASQIVAPTGLWAPTVAPGSLVRSPSLSRRWPVRDVLRVGPIRTEPRHLHSFRFTPPGLLPVGRPEPSARYPAQPGGRSRLDGPGAH